MKKNLAAFALAAVLAAVAAAADVPGAPEGSIETLRMGTQYLLDNQDKMFAHPAATVGMSGLLVYTLASTDDTLLLPAQVEAKAAAVKKGVEILLANAQPDGSIGVPDQGMGNYNTCIAILALATVDPKAHGDVIAKAIAYILTLQASEETGFDKTALPYGGIGYTKTLETVDNSNTQWAIQALADSGFDPERKNPVWARAVLYVSKTQNTAENQYIVGIKGMENYRTDGKGGMTYRPGESKAELIKNPDGTVTAPSYGSMTYAGIKTMIYAGVSRDDPRVVAALRYIRENYTLDENPGLRTDEKPELGQQGIYYYYYTFAKCLKVVGLENNTLTDFDGGAHVWPADILGKLVSLRKTDAGEGKCYWLNEAEERWMEGEPTLATCYSIMAMNVALDALKAPAAAPAVETPAEVPAIEAPTAPTGAPAPTGAEAPRVSA